MKINQFLAVIYVMICLGCNQPQKTQDARSPELKEILSGPSSQIVKTGNFDCEADELSEVSNLESLKKSGRQALADTTAGEDDGTEITMLVVYTTKAKNEFANKDSLLNSIRRAETKTNQVFVNNGIDLHVKIVHIEEITAFREGTMKSDLGAVISGTKGQTTRDLRDKHFADVVCLIRSDGGGRATLLNPITQSYHSESAYMTIGSGCIDQSYFCFAHELGHLLGCNHNKEDTDLKGMYDYSYGWHFDLPDDNPNIGRIGTMMSYPGAENRLLYFSDPALGYHGVAIGSEKANNAKTIKLTKKIVANYRVKPLA